MKSSRFFILVVGMSLSYVITTNADLLGILTCGSVAGLNLIRCKTPIINADGSKVNCISDCVCIHGFDSAKCENGTCKCYNNSTLNGDQINEQRQRLCGDLIAGSLQKGFMTLLCPTPPLSGTCKADCVCGHQANSGACLDNQYTLNGINFDICKCEY